MRQDYPQKPRLSVATVALMTALSLPQAHAQAAADPGLCVAAARNAAQETGVPLQVLLAVALSETGRMVDGRLQPWPWAMNANGDSHWFDTPEALLAAAEAQIEQGLSNFDVGCFQLNHRWHSDAFPSMAAMIDPDRNALHAARFLTSLYQEMQDWSDAAAAYHSRTPEYAERYRARFETILASLDDGPVSAPLLRENRYPFLQSGVVGTNGSVVPLFTAEQPLIGGPET